MSNETNNDFQVEVSAQGTRLDRIAVEGKAVSFVPGLCAVSQAHPYQPREREWYAQNILERLLSRGEVSDGRTGPFDDRKFWLNPMQYRESGLVVPVGITHYKAFRDDLNLPEQELTRLNALGLAQHRDPYAFLNCRVPGIAALVINNDGTIFIGARTNKEDTGLLNAVAGHLTYRERPEDVKLESDLERELSEEFGIQRDRVINAKFVGIYRHPKRGDADFTYVVWINLPRKYFASGDWMKKVREREHKSLIEITSRMQIAQLLNDGTMPGDDKRYKLQYSARGALMSIREGELRD